MIEKALIAGCIATVILGAYIINQLIDYHDVTSCREKLRYWHTKGCIIRVYVKGKYFCIVHHDNYRTIAKWMATQQHRILVKSDQEISIYFRR